MRSQDPKRRALECITVGKDDTGKDTRLKERE